MKFASELSYFYSTGEAMCIDKMLNVIISRTASRLFLCNDVDRWQTHVPVY